MRVSFDYLRGRAARNLVMMLLAIFVVSRGAAVEPIDVDGAGWWRDRTLQRSLAALLPSEEIEYYDANAVEDAAFFVISTLVEDGYLRPVVAAEIRRSDGSEHRHEFDHELTNLLSRPLRVARLRLVVDRGVRYRFGALTIEGMPIEWTDRDASDLMVPRAGIMERKIGAVYSPSAVRQGLGRVEYALRRRGHAEARARVTREHFDHVSGAVELAIDVVPGERWSLGEIEFDAPLAGGIESPAWHDIEGQLWTDGIEQDVAERIRRAGYRAGYPDIRINLERKFAELSATSGSRVVNLVAQVVEGPAVTLGSVEYAGAEYMHQRVLDRRVRLKANTPLNPIEVENARRRLERLRAFSRVRVDYDPVDGTPRSPVFEFQRRPPWESSLLLGYGSFEAVRAGFQVRGNNVLGRAHDLRLEAIGSVKSLSGELVYSVPDVFGELIDGNVRLFGLDRDEFTFQRQEYGGALALSRRNLPWVKSEGSVSYTYEELLNRESILGTQNFDLEQATAASITLGLSRDERDNPLLPRDGYRWYAQAELAAAPWGSEVDFQRFEAGVSWHLPLTDDSWIHMGISHGTVLTLGEPNDLDLPVNKRFFPGGENSLRGFQANEAVPRDANGQPVGAKSFTLLNLEIEQALSSRVSAVLFFDALGMTAQISALPALEGFYSLGLGVRYQTIIGPVRLEYGHNLNPRSGDPDGTLHFSLGYPF